MAWPDGRPPERSRHLEGLGHDARPAEEAEEGPSRRRLGDAHDLRAALDEGGRGGEEERARAGQQHPTARQDALGLDQGGDASGGDDPRERPARHCGGSVVGARSQDERSSLEHDRAAFMMEEQHAIGQHAPHLGAGEHRDARSLEIGEQESALRPGAGEGIAGRRPDLGWQLTVDLATGTGSLVENQDLGARRARRDGGTDSGGSRAHDHHLVDRDGGCHGRSPFTAGSPACPKPSWVSTTIPARAGTRQVRMLASPSTTMRQSWHTPIAQKTPRGALRCAVRRAVRRSSARRAVAMVSPG